MIHMQTFSAELNLLGEGPAWHMEEKCLYWVDILTNKVFRLDTLTNKIDSRIVPEYPSAVIPTTGPYCLLAVKEKVILFSFDEGIVSTLAEIEVGMTTQRCNDGKCDPWGRLWIGTMDMYEAKGAGVVYRIDHRGTSQALIRDVTISNGMAWDVDKGYFYHIDTPTKSICCYTYDDETGNIGEVQDVIPIDHVGWPDGMCIDSEGMLWVAMWDGWAVIRVDPKTKKVIAKIELPVSRPTSCVFGGVDLSDMYITSARVGIEDVESQPLAGSLFLVQGMEVKGRETQKFSINNG